MVSAQAFLETKYASNGAMKTQKRYFHSNNWGTCVFFNMSQTNQEKRNEGSFNESLSIIIIIIMAV